MSCSSIVLTDKESKEFNDKKFAAFQGTMILCGVYAIVALIMLVLINYTTFGKDIIYNKFLPFVITYVFGAILIIIYLVIVIYELQPTKNKSLQDNDIICPDYWKIKELTTEEINFVKQNTSLNINNMTDDEIRYKCEIDKNITPLSNYKNTTNNLIYGYTSNYLSTGNDKDRPNYLYVDYNDNNIEMKKYAQFAGIYNKKSATEYNIINANSLTSNLNNDRIVEIPPNSTLYPLICNEVYPQYLAKLDEKDGGNKNRCEYAKKCNIAWNDIGC